MKIMRPFLREPAGQEVVLNTQMGLYEKNLRRPTENRKQILLAGTK
jgi:hypothetical protein